MTTIRSLVLRLALVAVAGILPTLSGGTAVSADTGAGEVVEVTPLPEPLWIPETTGSAYRLTYRTTDARGGRALSTGAVFLPQGTPPPEGWPVVSWAHGTVGLADTCAPSLHPRSARDAGYLATWMREGYAVVASDYSGLGTPGLMAYLDGRSTGANITDMVLAARSATASMAPHERLDDKWVVIGQSQGAGAAVQAARYATEDGGGALDYRGAVGTGTPAYIERIVEYVGPTYPPAPLPGALNAYVIYILAGFRSAHPELDIDSLLTATGRKYLALAETECLSSMVQKSLLVPIGTFFTQPLSTLPGFRDALVDYLAMPESGFDKPFFLGHGVLDTDVPIFVTQPWVAKLQKNGEPVTWKTYLTSHSGTMAASLPDTLPFVRALLAD